MKDSNRYVVWSGPKGGRWERIPMVPPHIRVRSAKLLPRRKGELKEVIRLQLLNYAKKDEAPAEVRVMYSDKVVGSEHIPGLLSGKAHEVEAMLELPRVAYAQERVPLKIYLNELLIGTQHLRPSPPPPEMAKPIGGIRRSMRPKGAPGPGCLPTVDAWLEPDRDTFFTDEIFTLNWRADCADDVVIGWEDSSAARALRELENARNDIYPDAGMSMGVGYPLEGSEEILVGGPGEVEFHVQAYRAEAHAEQILGVHLINKPDFSGCGADREDCILDMLRHIEPLVPEGITQNENLDTVDVFRDGVLDRYEFGLKVEEALERLDRLTFVCQECTDEEMESGACPGGDYNEGRPDEVNLQFSDHWYPTDYAILHELCHIAGFNSDLVPEYSHDDVERMTAEVSGAPFDRARTCGEY